MIRRILSVVCGALLMAIAVPAAHAQKATLELPAESVQAGALLDVTFTAPAGLPNNAWVGIVPSDVPHGEEAVNDQHDLTYQSLNGKTSGTLQFRAPQKPGRYDLRMNDSDSNGKEIASVTFSVEALDLSGASLKLSSSELYPRAKVEVQFEAPSGLPDNGWIGIVPSAIPHGDEAVNDRNNLGYEYMRSKTSGVVALTAPEKPGRYDVRMHDTDANGVEIASATFTVKGPDYGAASLTLEAETFAVGEEIRLQFSAPEGLARNAWVGIVPSDIEHGDEARNDAHDVMYKYLEGKTSGTLVFRAPSTDGKFDFRMHDTDSSGVEIAASRAFTVGGEIDASSMKRQLESSGRVVLYGIHFATDSAVLDETSRITLEQVAELLGRSPELELLIEGHTDSQGDEAYNRDLSLRRAEAVKGYLVKELGIAGARLTTAGKGETVPLGNNDSEAGRAQNRRVELVSR